MSPFRVRITFVCFVGVRQGYSCGTSNANTVYGKSLSLLNVNIEMFRVRQSIGRNKVARGKEKVGHRDTYYINEAGYPFDQKGSHTKE